MHSRQGLSFAEKPAVTDKLTCPAEAPLFMRHPLKAVRYGVVDSLQGATQDYAEADGKITQERSPKYVQVYHGCLPTLNMLSAMLPMQESSSTKTM